MILKAIYIIDISSTKFYILHHYYILGFFASPFAMKKNKHKQQFNYIKIIEIMSKTKQLNVYNTFWFGNVYNNKDEFLLSFSK